MRGPGVSICLYATISLWCWRSQFFPYTELLVNAWPGFLLDLDLVTLN